MKGLYTVLTFSYWIREQYSHVPEYFRVGSREDKSAESIDKSRGEARITQSLQFISL